MIRVDAVPAYFAYLRLYFECSPEPVGRGGLVIAPDLVLTVVRESDLHLATVQAGPNGGIRMVERSAKLHHRHEGSGLALFKFHEMLPFVAPPLMDVWGETRPWHTYRAQPEGSRWSCVRSGEDVRGDPSVIGSPAILTGPNGQHHLRGLIGSSHTTDDDALIGVDVVRSFMRDIGLAAPRRALVPGIAEAFTLEPENHGLLLMASHLVGEADVLFRMQQPASAAYVRGGTGLAHWPGLDDLPADFPTDRAAVDWIKTLGDMEYLRLRFPRRREVEACLRAQAPQRGSANALPLSLADYLGEDGRPIMPHGACEWIRDERTVPLAVNLSNRLLVPNPVGARDFPHIRRSLQLIHDPEGLA